MMVLNVTGVMAPRRLELIQWQAEWGSRAVAQLRDDEGRCLSWMKGRLLGKARIVEGSCDGMIRRRMGEQVKCQGPRANRKNVRVQCYWRITGR